MLTHSISLKPATLSQPLYFSSLTVNNGLPSNITTNIEFDSQGFIWIGTHDGLCRFDGKRFETFQHHSIQNSIESNQISALINNNDYLWIGTWSGLSVINTKTFEIHKLDIGENNSVRTFYKDNSDNIWVGTTNGASRFKDLTEPPIIYTKENCNLSHNTIRSIYQSADGSIWIGTYHQLNKLSNDSITTYDLKQGYKPLLKNN